MGDIDENALIHDSNPFPNLTKVKREPKLLNRARGYQRTDNIIIIDRSSPWGNPYVMGEDGDRNEVCDKHIVWLNEWIKNKKEIIVNGFSNKWVVENINKLRGKDIACWCDPLRCHGIPLIELANRE